MSEHFTGTRAVVEGSIRPRSSIEEGVIISRSGSLRISKGNDDSALLKKAEGIQAFLMSPAGDPSSIPGRGAAWQPTPVFLPG